MLEHRSCSKSSAAHLCHSTSIQPSCINTHPGMVILHRAERLSKVNFPCSQPQTSNFMGPSSFQWCPATGQGPTGTNWSIGSSIWTWGRTSSPWGWRSTGTGCPGRWWSLLLWRYSRPAWTRSSTTYCRGPCFGRRVGLDDPQRSLPTPTILWFCDFYEKSSSKQQSQVANPLLNQTTC